MLCLLVIEGCLVSTFACVWMWRLLKEVSRTRYALFGVFMGVPAGFVRALAVKQIVIDEDDDGDSDSEFGDDIPADQKAAANAEANTTASAGAAAASAVRPAYAAARRAGPSGFVVEVQGAEGGARSPVNRGFHPLRGLLEGARKMLTRSDSRGSMNGADASGGRRTLSRDARDVLLLLVPFLAWGVALIAIYALSFQELRDMEPALTELNVVNYVVAGVTRCVYLAQELSLAAAGDQPGWKTKLDASLKSMLLEYTVLLYGANAGGAEAQVPHFEGAQGAAFRTRAISDTFFPEVSSSICFRCVAARRETREGGQTGTGSVRLRLVVAPLLPLPPCPAALSNRRLTRSQPFRPPWFCQTAARTGPSASPRATPTSRRPRAGCTP
jgi:hypothetical protein